MKDFQFPSNRSFLMQRTGDISQLAGAKRSILADGKAQGVEAVDIKTGTGFAFTVLPGRGMDIAWAEYKGAPVSYMSKTGVVSPAYYESSGGQWLRSFFAGLLTTCGLSNVGGPCEEDDPVLGIRQYGQHGRISNCAAEQVGVTQEWHGDDFLITVTGLMREACLFGENLTLRRTICAKLGENRLSVHDVIVNEGFAAQPLMILYHINFGYPILDEGSRFLCASSKIEPATEIAKSDMDRFSQMGAPEVGYRERVYFHEPIGDAGGQATAALINDRLELGAYVRFNTGQMSKLTQWKQLGAQEYVLGVEPGNCLSVGRVKQRERGDLETILPGEQRTFDVEIGILPDRDAIAQISQEVGSAA